MADEQQDKSEEASPHKLREARKKGQVAKSVEVNSWILLVSFSLLMVAFWPQISEQFSEFIVRLTNVSYQMAMNDVGMLKLFDVTSTGLMQILGPVALLLMVTAILANIIQTKPIFSTHPIKPDFSRMNPAKGIKKLFNRKVLFELLKALLKVTVFGVVVFIGVTIFLPTIVQNVFSAPQVLADNIVGTVFKAVLFLQALMLPIVALDFLFSTKDFKRQMRMSKRDLKDEYKKNEGHPEVKSKRKEIQKELLKKASSLGQVKDADIIVTNPTHYAVALKYDMDKMAAPIVLAKGSGPFAAKIKQQAMHYGKPILRKPKLARLLYRKTNIDAVIPLESFNDVAEVYRWLFKLRQEK